ncbi:MAG: hypothetical protein COB69_00275 [Phycisphaera sp.]|nr:MAG: hypothetical protein COB69_00275 [Phycisphaera sp.]
MSIPEIIKSKLIKSAREAGAYIDEGICDETKDYLVVVDKMQWEETALDMVTDSIKADGFYDGLRGYLSDERIDELLEEVKSCERVTERVNDDYFKELADNKY